MNTTNSDPALFDAMAPDVTAAEVAARLRAMNEAATRDRFEASAANTLAQLEARYGADGMAGVKR